MFLCSPILAMLSLLAQTTKPAAPKAAPKTDQEIQSCIVEGLNRASRMRSEGFTVTVAAGVATFTGTARQPGSKGGVYAIAAACGAAKVINNISTEPKGASRKK